MGISQLKENPVELSLRSPISGFTINSWNVKDDQLVLDMSVEYKKLSPSSEVLVRAAIVRTMTQLEGISYVSVTVGGEALTDSLGNVVGPMTADLFIDNAGNEINAYEKTRLLLYFTNEDGERLIGVQTKPVVYSSNISMEKLVVERLIAGPDAENEELYPVINPATKVLGVTVKDGTCYVNLDNGFLTQTYNVSRRGSDLFHCQLSGRIVEHQQGAIAVNGNTDMFSGKKFHCLTCLTGTLIWFTKRRNYNHKKLQKTAVYGNPDFPDPLSGSASAAGVGGNRTLAQTRQRKRPLADAPRLHSLTPGWKPWMAKPCADGQSHRLLAACRWSAGKRQLLFKRPFYRGRCLIFCFFRGFGGNDR